MNNEQLLSQLADIELPISEPSTAPMIWLVIGALIILAFVAYIFWRKQQTVQHDNDSSLAVEKLNQLHQQWREGNISNREAAYRLSTILRLGLKLEQLTLTPPKHLENNHKQWQHCIKQLQNTRYEHSDSHAMSEDIFALSRDWLTQRGQTSS